MKKSFFLVFFCIFSLQITAQYNFGFEDFKPGTDTLQAWNRKSGPSFYGPVFNIDKDIKHSGKQSLSIERKSTDTATSFTPINVEIPANFEGSTLTVSCWLKTENVSNYVQLWFRIDDENAKMLNLTNYPRNSLNGTTDWTQYVTTVNLPADAHVIYFGFLIMGTGKVWADDFNLLVDGKPLNKVNKILKPSFAARKDNLEFKKSSAVSISGPSFFQIENLAVLGKIWGFLKYYHPFVASGNLNWDYELFRFLPSYLSVENITERNDLLLQWINKMPRPAVCNNCNDKMLEQAIYKPDLEWINDNEVLGDSLSMILAYIKNNRHQGKNYYMDLIPGVKNPKILHEDDYGQFTYPDAGYRLLSLFRYWNLIQYWFPYKHLIGEDWKTVLTEFIPKMINVENAAEYVLTTQQLIARVHDTHANIWSSNKILDSIKGKFYPPVKLTFVGDQAVVTQLINADNATLSNLQIGDVIQTVNGKKVKDIIKERLSNLPASNRPTQLRDLAMLLLRSNDSTGKISILRNGETMETTVYRTIPKKLMDWYHQDFAYQNDSSFFFIQPGIGYINLGRIKVSQIDSVFDALKNSKGLIIDNRQYPGEFPIYTIAGKLLPKREVFCKIPVGSLEYPGMFIIKKPLYAGKKNMNYYKGKVTILVDEGTQSSGEFHSMAFRIAPDAKVIGSTTAGADGNVSGFNLPGGIYTMFSGISILNPDGSETQRAGIIPDMEVKRTVAGIKQHKDELLLKAVGLINGNDFEKKD